MMGYINILLADDDEDDRFFFEKAFSTATIAAQVTSVEDGDQLSNLLETITSPPPPDIIFLDINMPCKSGLDCLREIRNTTRFKDTPIVMFSTSSHPRHIDETFKNGANRYISKADFFGNEISMLNKLFSPDWKTSLFHTEKENYVLKAG